MNDIKIGTTLYRKISDNIEEVEVKEIYLEAYISGYKTILKVKTKSGLTYTHFVSDLGFRLLTELPEEGEK